MAEVVGTLRQAQCPAGEWKRYVSLDNGKAAEYPCGEECRSMEGGANGASMEQHLDLAAIMGIKDG